MCQNESVERLPVKDYIEIAVLLGAKYARMVNDEHITCSELLCRLIPVYFDKEIEEGLYRKNGRLIGVIHDSSNTNTVLQLLAMASMLNCQMTNLISRYHKDKYQEELNLQIVAFIESFKQNSEKLKKQKSYIKSGLAYQ